MLLTHNTHIQQRVGHCCKFVTNHDVMLVKAGKDHYQLPLRYPTSCVAHLNVKNALFLPL